MEASTAAAANRAAGGAASEATGIPLHAWHAVLLPAHCAPALVEQRGQESALAHALQLVAVAAHLGLQAARARARAAAAAAMELVHERPTRWEAGG